MRINKWIPIIFMVTGLAISPAVHSAQPNQLKIQNNIKYAVKPQFASLALPVAWAARPGKIFITWEPRADAAGYYIYRKDKTTNVEVCLNDLDPLLKGSPKSKPIAKLTPVTLGNCLIAGSQEMKDIAAVLQIDPNSPEQFFAPTQSSLQPYSLNQTKPVDRDEMRRVLRQLYSGAARAMGTGYLDQNGLAPGKSYEYKVVPVINNQEASLYGGTVTAVNIDSSAAMNPPTPNECPIYPGDQTVELLWPKAQNILAYDVYRTAASKPGQPERLNKFAIAMTISIPSNTPGGNVANPIIRKHPTPQPVVPSSAGPLKISDATNAAVAKAPNLTQKTMAYYVDITIVSNSATSGKLVPFPGQPGPTPDSSRYKVIHEVKNSETYQYRIIPRDILGPVPNSALSLTLKATPVDRIKPGIPDPLKFSVYYRKLSLPVPATNPGCCADSCPLCKNNWVYPKAGTEYDKINCGLNVSWSPVLLNEDGYPEDVKSYKLWRFDSPGAAAKNESAKGVLIGTRTRSSAQYALPLLTSLTDDKAKRETMYWYRVEVTDSAGHSSFSAPFSAYYHDNLPPLAPANVRVVPTKTNLDLTEITVKWDPAKDWENPAVNAADIAGYRIYRRVCGTQPRTQRNAVSGSAVDSMPTQEDVVKGNYKDFLVPIGTIMAEPNKVVYSFTDGTLPPESPNCWEYCVRAFDKSQNMSKDHTGNVSCGRLTKTKGPRAATITSLTARGNAVRIDWVAPPSIDLYTFRIFRLESGDPQVKGNWIPIFHPVFHGVIRCEDTPPVPPDFCAGLDPGNGQPTINAGKLKNTYYFIDDQNIQPNKKYTYKIVSYDFLENPKDDSKYLADSTSTLMSTFTYDRYVSGGLGVPGAIYDPSKGVVLSWMPPSGVSNITYMVYRSSKSSNDGFTPLAAGLTKPAYIDATARPGVAYWYKIQYVTASGHYSPLSGPAAVPAQILNE